jgi:23S rRNA (cytidine2498-2'-O)-methyltransferase
LKQKQRRLCKSHQPHAQTPLSDDAFIVNVACTSATTGFISVIAPSARNPWGPSLSRFAGGYVPIAQDLRPPARAYRKLREALAHLDLVPTAAQTWVDLGAAPGSWSFDAIEAGAHVFAIDRSPLRDDLMQAPNCTFVKTDAFTYRPDAPVDVLVCDVIAFPERNIALLESWLSEGLCRAFVVTLKFRGEDDYTKVDACKAVLAQYAHRYVFRQLYHNKNEVTAAGYCAPKKIEEQTRVKTHEAR